MAAEFRPVVEPAPRRKRRRSQMPLVVGLVAVVAVLTGLLFVLLGPGRGGPDRTAATGQGDGDQSKLASVTETDQPAADGATGEEEQPAKASRYLVVDTGRMPWAPPTSGPHPRLDYLPPGSQLMLLVRPADLLATDEGPLLVRGLGPLVEAGIQRLEAWCGCPARDMESLQAGWQGGGPDEVIGGVAVRLAEGQAVPATAAARAAAWGPTKPATAEGETYYKGQGSSFWAPSWEDGRVLVVTTEAAASGGPAAVGEPLMLDTIREAVRARDLPADELAVDLPRDLTVLTRMLDADRHLTLFGTPHFLLNRGRAALAGPLERLFKPLQWFFGESIAAAGLSLHFGDSCYLELDAVTPFARPPRQEAPELFARLAALPTAVEGSVAALNPGSYGRILVLRLPSMLRLLVANARWAPEGEGIVVNAYLPRHAAHNLAVAVDLTLAQAPDAAAVARGAPAAASGGTAGLASRITIVFPKDTLEMAVQMVADQCGIPMEIVGPDLQLEGITKNQSFGLDERDKPAREVLGVILAKANPDGKLVYVVRREGESETILITTRAAAEKRGDELPPEFARP